MYLLDCYIEHPVRSVDQTFTYCAEAPCEPGVRVTVDFNHREITGFVSDVHETDETIEQASQRIGYPIKPVKEILDEESLITPELVSLAAWMKEATLSTTISCYQSMLPGKVKPKGKNKGVVEETWVSVSDREVSLTPKQLAAYQFVEENGPLLYSRLRRHFPSLAKKLVEKGAVIQFRKEREAPSRSAEVKEGPKLTADQLRAVNEIEESSDRVFLLHGQTGSGKTEVYLHLAKHALERGKQVLILVPEISLTPQMIERVSSRFGSELAIYHSGLNPQEKYEQYRMVRNGRAEIVVGTRSAVFLPFQNLGLIVMDEEQDASYKQDNQPAYHCRDAAVFRAEYHDCKVVLGSATPSLESYARTLKNVYHLVELKERINLSLPEVTVVPLKEAMNNGESYILTDTLCRKMKDHLQAHKQVLLLLNRRGFHTMLRCSSCKEPLTCRHCDITLSYHHATKTMVCHSCGTSYPIPSVCPSCGSHERMMNLGFGTEKLEEEVRLRFPDCRVLRMDADTTSGHNAHEKILTAFGRHEADILVGTQMIAKGLDYPDVTLVGILNGDEGLKRSDYRSCEVTFDLLMQAAGRSGRSDAKGEVVLQVFDPEHYAVKAAAAQNYELFFQQEMRYRHAAQEPPYTYLISITIAHRNEAAMESLSARMLSELHGTFRVIGVIPLPRRRDLYRARILLKGKNLDEMRQALGSLLKEDRNLAAKDIRIDVNPLTLE